ncbi:MAG: hypothetical protein IV107_17800 [Paucibacter sp.]|nr:hypothetical protein [Roseateles sp.]
MSIQLVLSHYLAGFRERDELDALLPELLKAMGHSVLSRPQIGVGQAGVDVVSTKKNDQDVLEVFLFVIKFGDVGREDFYGGKQAIDPSIREAANDFVRNRLPKSLGGLQKRIVLLTNGELKQEAQSSYAALSKDIGERPLCSLEFWGTDQLTPLIEQHLFDEALLLATGKSDLRAALAGLEESDTSIRRFVRFANACFKVPEKESTQSAATRKRKFLKRCATAAMGWGVLLVWGKNEDNLKPGVVAGEYMVLRLWSEAVKAGFQDDAAFEKRLQAVVPLHIRSLLDYYAKTAAQLLSCRAVLGYRPDRILYAELMFEEFGRLATLLLLLQCQEGQETLRTEAHRLLVRLVNEHTGCHLPVYDGQTIDITLVLTALMGEHDWASAKRMLGNSVARLQRAVKTDQYLPVDTDVLEDAVALCTTGGAEPREFFQTSTLVPALATFAALLQDEESLRCLREEVEPHLQDVTLERWFPTVELETLTGSKRGVPDVGVSRAVAGGRATIAEESEASLRPFVGAAGPRDFKWHDKPWAILVALSSRLHRHPLPTWFIAQYAPQSE